MWHRSSVLLLAAAFHRTRFLPVSAVPGTSWQLLQELVAAVSHRPSRAEPVPWTWHCGRSLSEQQEGDDVPSSMSLVQFPWWQWILAGALPGHSTWLPAEPEPGGDGGLR